MRILLAEDEKEMSNALCAVLQHNNYSVDAVFNGRDALDYAMTGNYDAAYDLLCHSLDINPLAAEGWYYLSMYQSELGKDSLARLSLEQAAALNPDNDIYQERLGQRAPHLERGRGSRYQCWRRRHNNPRPDSYAGL